MKRQFTIITKNGSKWLRPTDVLSDVFNVIYIGSRPEGTVLDESEVKTVSQGRNKGMEEWITEDEGEYPKWAEYRIAYTDAEPTYSDTFKQLGDMITTDQLDAAQELISPAESHDRHINDEYPGIDYQPLFNHMSNEHGLTLTTSEMDEIIALSTYILAKK